MPLWFWEDDHQMWLWGHWVDDWVLGCADAAINQFPPSLN